MTSTRRMTRQEQEEIGNRFAEFGRQSSCACKCISGQVWYVYTQLQITCMWFLLCPVSCAPFWLICLICHEETSLDVFFHKLMFIFQRYMQLEVKIYNVYTYIVESSDIFAYLLQCGIQLLGRNYQRTTVIQYISSNTCCLLQF